MRILGINFGHDASFALLEDGQLTAFRELERFSRLKHQMGVTSAELVLFLQECDLGIDQIDCVALCATQSVGAHTDKEICCVPGYHPDHHSFAIDVWCGLPVNFFAADLTHHINYGQHVQRIPQRSVTPFPDTITEGLSSPIGLPRYPADFDMLLRYASALIQFDDSPPSDAQEQLLKNLYPDTLVVQNCCKPAFFVPHHLAHAASAAYFSPPSHSLIVSHDGGIPSFKFNSGGIFLAGKRGLYPLLSHSLNLGFCYENWGNAVGLVYDPGKFMGLSAYALPIVHRMEGLIQAYLEACSFNRVPSDAFTSSLLDDLILHSHIQSHPRRALERFPFKLNNPKLAAQIAANAQYLVEQVWERGLMPVIEFLRDKLALAPEVSIVGGFSLNCPANARLQNACKSSIIQPLPIVGDTGIALGAAVYLNAVLTGTLPRASKDLDPAFLPRPKHYLALSAPSDPHLVRIHLNLPPPAGWPNGCARARCCVLYRAYQKSARVR